MTSIMTAFLIAFAKSLIHAKVINHQVLKDEFIKVRKHVKHEAPLAAADLEILSLMNIKPEDDPGKG